MARFRQSIMRWLMLLSFGVLPGFVECDFDDGELEIDFEDIDWDTDDLWVDVWWDIY